MGVVVFREFKHKKQTVHCFNLTNILYFYVNLKKAEVQKGKHVNKSNLWIYFCFFLSIHELITPLLVNGSVWEFKNPPQIILTNNHNQSETEMSLIRLTCWSQIRCWCRSSGSRSLLISGLRSPLAPAPRPRLLLCQRLFIYSRSPSFIHCYQQERRPASDIHSCC